jgi:hypothetical protein
LFRGQEVKGNADGEEEGCLVTEVAGRVGLSLNLEARRLKERTIERFMG